MNQNFIGIMSVIGIACLLFIGWANTVWLTKHYFPSPVPSSVGTCQHVFTQETLPGGVWVCSREYKEENVPMFETPFSSQFRGSPPPSSLPSVEERNV